MDKNFPSTVLLSAIEMSLKCSKKQAEARADGEWFLCKFWNILTSFLRSITERTWENFLSIYFFTIALAILTSISVMREKDKKQTNKQTTNEQTSCATITSFLWSVLLSNVALDKSAREKSLCYGKILNIPMLLWFLFRHQTDPRRLLSTGRDPESNFWWIASYGNVFASLNRFVEFGEMLEEWAVCFIDCNCVWNYAALKPRSLVVWTDKVMLRYFAALLCKFF